MLQQGRGESCGGGFERMMVWTFIKFCVCALLNAIDSEMVSLEGVAPAMLQRCCQNESPLMTD